MQCHFGQDSLSLARLGAKAMGADLSDKVIDRTKDFNAELGLDAEFICCDIYDLPNHLNEKFDIVLPVMVQLGGFRTSRNGQS